MSWQQYLATRVAHGTALDGLAEVLQKVAAAHSSVSCKHMPGVTSFKLHRARTDFSTPPADRKRTCQPLNSEPEQIHSVQLLTEAPSGERRLLQSHHLALSFAGALFCCTGNDCEKKDRAGSSTEAAFAGRDVGCVLH